MDTRMEKKKRCKRGRHAGVLGATSHVPSFLTGEGEQSTTCRLPRARGRRQVCHAPPTPTDWGIW